MSSAPRQKTQYRSAVRQWLGAAALCLPLTALAHGDGHARLAELDARIARQPEDAALYLRRGRLHMESDHFDKAVADLARALALAPAQTGTRYFLAEALLAEGRADLAEAEAQRFIDAQPPQEKGALSRGHWLLGRARMAQRHPDEALQAYRAARSFTEEIVPDQYQWYAEASLATGQAAHVDEALALLDQGMTAGGSVDTLGELAFDVALKSGRQKEALQRLDRLIAQNRRLPFLYARKAALLAAAGQPTDAAKAVQVARVHLARLPGHRLRAPAYVNLAHELDALAAQLASAAGGRPASTATMALKPSP